MDIKAHGFKVTVILNQEALKASLEKMATSPMATIKPDGITDTKPLDSPGKIRLFCVDQEMVMVIH
jgi:hypothetical protein